MWEQRLPGSADARKTFLAGGGSPVTWSAVLSAVRVSRHHGRAAVLDDVWLPSGPQSRVGVVGPKGMGRPTLRRTRAGREEPDGGRVERAPASLTVGFLPQEPDARAGETLRGYLARRTGVA